MVGVGSVARRRRGAPRGPAAGVGRASMAFSRAAGKEDVAVEFLQHRPFLPRPRGSRSFDARLTALNDGTGARVAAPACRSRPRSRQSPVKRAVQRSGHGRRCPRRYRGRVSREDRGADACRSPGRRSCLPSQELRGRPRASSSRQVVFGKRTDSPPSRSAADSRAVLADSRPDLLQERSVSPAGGSSAGVHAAVQDRAGSRRPGCA